MNDHTSNLKDMRNKMSRRNWLSDSAIVATGTILLPSLITGCRKDAWGIFHGDGGHGGGGLGDVPLTPEQLKAAADNLNRMRALLNDLYQNSFDYDETVFLALASTRQNTSWANFLVDIIIDIAAVAASTALAATGNPEFIPSIVCLSAFLHDWGIGKDRPEDLTTLDGFFTEYQGGQLAMKQAIDQHLGHLTDVGTNNDYANLQAAWKDPIVFNNKPYTLADLANTYFPEKTNNADDYYSIYDPMYDHHKKSVWNLAIMKCCLYYRNWPRYIQTLTVPGGVLLDWARNTFYPASKGAYLRAVYWEKHIDVNPNTIEWEIDEYWLGIDGNQFPDDASNILFKDDTPGHIINPDGLFNRSYVFEQFSLRKFEFPYGHELGDDLTGNINAAADDFNFTGGFFPQLIHL
ncbi:MAG: hypothetical protein ABI863_17220 [Ginsengibacter sp.]